MNQNVGLDFGLTLNKTIFFSRNWNAHIVEKPNSIKLPRYHGTISGSEVQLIAFENMDIMDRLPILLIDEKLVKMLT